MDQTEAHKNGTAIIDGPPSQTELLGLWNELPAERKSQIDPSTLRGKRQLVLEFIFACLREEQHRAPEDQMELVFSFLA